jgi:hypothetical protein
LLGLQLGLPLLLELLPRHLLLRLDLGLTLPLELLQVGGRALRRRTGLCGQRLLGYPLDPHRRWRGLLGQ